MSSEEMNLVEAVRASLHHKMSEDDSVVILGEDVGRNGGVFRATDGLQQQFGCERVMDTPLAESMISGLAVGMATQGLKPVAEIQFMGFLSACLEQISCHAARFRNRTRGRFSCPLVIRAPYGGGINAPEHHSESTEAIWAHIPGLKVLIPSTPQEAYSLLCAAVEDPDPVLFLEPKRLYRAFQQKVDRKLKLPLGKAFQLSSGSDLCLISWGSSMLECYQVSERLQQQGYSIALVNVATISPLDRQGITSAVAESGRALIVHEACHSFGPGAEIAASLQENLFGKLRAPIRRLSGFDTVMPYFQNEKDYLPQADDIYRAAMILLEEVEL